jgi:hypothetical protein
MCHIAQQAGPLYWDNHHCQGGGLGGLQHAWTAGLVGLHLGEGDSCSWLHTATPAAILGNEGRVEVSLPPCSAAT